MRFIGWKIQTKVRLGGGRWCWILWKHCGFSVCIWVTRLNTGEFHWKVVLLEVEVEERVRWKAPKPWCFAGDNWNSKSAPRDENADLIAHDFQPADPTWVLWFTHGRNGILCPWKGATRSYIVWRKSGICACRIWMIQFIVYNCYYDICMYLFFS